MAVGAGWQAVVAPITLCCYYFAGVPVGALLAFVAGLSVKVRKS